MVGNEGSSVLELVFDLYLHCHYQLVRLHLKMLFFFFLEKREIVEGCVVKRFVEGPMKEFEGLELEGLRLGFLVLEEVLFLFLLEKILKEIVLFLLEKVKEILIERDHF